MMTTEFKFVNEKGNCFQTIGKQAIPNKYGEVRLLTFTDEECNKYSCFRQSTLQKNKIVRK